MIRNDFVSNSSSSSFIICESALSQFFNITKSDIENAILDLNGNDHSVFDIYDMKNDTQRNNCLKKYHNLFKQWDPCQLENNEYYLKFLSALNEIGVNSYTLNWSEKKDQTYFDRETKKDKKIPDYLLKTNKFLREKLGIYTMYEIAESDVCKYVIHFQENDVWNIDGCTTTGLKDIRDYSTKKTIAEAHKCIFETEHYTLERFIEIFTRYLIEKGKIDTTNKDFMNWWLVPEHHWWKTDPKSKYKNRKYFTDKDGIVTWKDIYEDMLKTSIFSVLHEG